MKPLFYTIAALMSALVVGCTDNVPTQASQPIRTQGITEMNEQENDDEAVEEQVDVKVSKKAAIAIAEMQDDVDKPETFSNTERIRLVSYNCENLYDTEDDPKTNDDEFTPDGVKKWNKAKYKIKLINVSKAIRAAGNGTMPALVGLLEVENKTVLRDLCNQDIMKTANYRYVHKDSRDARGIDVALLYRTDLINMLEERWVTVKQNSGRDILYAKCQLNNKEVLHVLVNHWPSMREGEAQSESKREVAAKAARRVVDSLRKAEKGDLNIVLMGDFNSTIKQSAMSNILKVKAYDKNEGKGSLCDLTSRYDATDNIGSHKYDGKWDVLDHMIVEGGMLDKNRKVFTTSKSGHICHETFLLSQSKSGYYSPKRSFKGDVWTSGYSDHLPVSMDLYLK